MKISGKGAYVDSNGKNHSFKGDVSFPVSDTWKSFNASGKVSFDEFSCSQIEIKGTCKGKSLSADDISVSGDFKVDSVKAKQSFQASGRIKVKNLDAENIIIESDESSAEEIKCVTIKIFNNETSDDDVFFSKIFGGGNFKTKSNSHVHIKNISAEKVELANCEVEEINCTDAIINSNCVIKKLTVKGNCDIAADSKAVEIIRG